MCKERKSENRTYAEHSPGRRGEGGNGGSTYVRTYVRTYARKYMCKERKSENRTYAKHSPEGKRGGGERRREDGGRTYVYEFNHPFIPLPGSLPPSIPCIAQDRCPSSIHCSINVASLGPSGSVPGTQWQCRIDVSIALLLLLLLPPICGYVPGGRRPGLDADGPVGL